MSTVKVHKARQGVGLRVQSHLAGHCRRGEAAGGGGMKHVFSELIPISYIRHIFL